MKNDDLRSLVIEKYRALIQGLRYVSRRHGYALTVHGSLARDIDLVAVPWRETAVPPEDVAEAIRKAAEAINGFAAMAEPEAMDTHHRAGCPGMKPHGRLVWSFHLGGGPYIDLSVVPPLPALRSRVCALTLDRGEPRLAIAMLIHLPKDAESSRKVLARRPISRASYALANGPAGKGHRSGNFRRPVSNRELRDRACAAFNACGWKVSGETWASLRGGAAVMGWLRLRRDERSTWALLRNSTDGAFGLTVQAGLEVGGTPLIGEPLARRRQTSEGAIGDACARFVAELPDGWESLAADAQALRRCDLGSARGSAALLCMATDRAFSMGFLREAEEAWQAAPGSGSAWALYRQITHVAKSWSPERQRQILVETRKYLVSVARAKRAA